jgi:membrane-associated phospholipid phosphatase
MSRRGLIALPPTRVDLAVAKACVRVANPPLERTVGVLTWLADEKVVLAGAAAFWIYARLGQPDRAISRQADQMLCCAVLAGILPHLFKHLVDRKRPDRTVVHGRRRGIPRSGDAWDSFPSGHALHLGAIAGTAARLLPPPNRHLVWPLVSVLAGTRIMLLAHYLSDVLAGLAFGAMLDKVVGGLFQVARSAHRRCDRSAWGDAAVRCEHGS